MICKNCNSEIPNDSEFCQCCGAEISKEVDSDKLVANKKGRVVTIMLGISTAVGVVFGVVMLCLFFNVNSVNNELSSQVNDLQAKIKSDETKYSTLEKKYNSLKSDYDDLEDDYRDCYDKASFMDRYIVFVGADGGRYHKFECPNLDLSSFWAYNIEAARGSHKPCDYCN